MNEFLAAKIIDLKELIGSGKTNDCRITLDGGKELHVSTKYDLPHFKIAVAGSEVFFSTSSASCQLRKIKAGLFRGCYCVIEKEGLSGNKTNVYVLANGFLKIAEEKGNLSDVEIDAFFKREYIEKLTAKKLNQFDITKQIQDYKLFCEKLPKSILRDEKFLLNVMKYFFSHKDIELAHKTNSKFINTDMCRTVAYNYLEDLSKTAKKENHEDSETHI